MKLRSPHGAWFVTTLAEAQDGSVIDLGGRVVTLPRTVHLSSPVTIRNGVMRCEDRRGVCMGTG